MKPPRSLRAGRVPSAVALLGLVAVRVPAFASEVSEAFDVSIEDATEQNDPVSARSVFAAVAGFTAGFLAHEGGHVLANVALGNHPHVTETHVGGLLPFPVIAPRIDCHDGACTKNDGQPFSSGPRGKFFIVTAGFHVQHVTDELLLAGEPALRDRHAPFRKALLAFNLVTSGIYAVGAVAGLEDEHGDLANAGRISGLDRRVLALGLLAPALLDGWRYLSPSSRVAPWASRVAKLAFGGLTVAF